MSSPSKAQTSTGTALSATGTGTAPSPKTPLARTTPPAGRRSSVRRPNGTSPSPLSDKGAGDGELGKMTKDQLVALLTDARQSLSSLQSSHSTLQDSHSQLQSSLEGKEEKLELLRGKLEQREEEVARAEEEVARLTEEKEGWEVKGKELERVKSQLKESEKKAREEAETYETERAAWIKQEQQLKLRLSTLRKDLPSPRRPSPSAPTNAEDHPSPEPAGLPEDPVPSGSSTTSPVVTILEAEDATVTDERTTKTEEPEEEEINFRRSPSFRQPRLHGASISSNSSLSPLSPTTTGGAGTSSPTLRSVTPPSTSTLPGVPLPPEMMAEWASLRTQHSQLLSSHQTLSNLLDSCQSELADEKRVNARLMEENESYELLVGEKTLRGEIDLEALLGRSASPAETEGSEDGLTGYSASVGSGGRQLEGVKEEDEEGEAGGEDDVEAMILETQGSGSRSTGAVEAKTTSTSTARKTAARKPMGLGLDLAAEMEKAEEEEEVQEREKEEKRKKAARKGQGRQGSASTPGSTNDVSALRAEVKNLKDANKALSLYISKIIDRVVAVDGFEKVLSADWSRNATTPPGTATQSAFAAAIKAVGSAAGGGGAKAKEEPKKSPGVEQQPKPQPAKRMSLGWGTLSPTSLFGGVGTSSSATKSSQAPPVPPAGMKPLKLVNPTSTASVSGGTTPVREASPPVASAEEDEEDSKERERLRAEMKLHGIEKAALGGQAATPTMPVPAGIEQTLEGAFAGDTASLKTSTSSRASRRTSGFYAASPQPPSSSTAGNKTPAESPPLGGTATVTGATVLKREEQREREIRANLERGSAGGFTEIRVSGHRRRPSNSSRSGNSTPSTSFRGTPDLDAVAAGMGAGGRRSASPLITSPSVEAAQPSLSASTSTTASAAAPPMSPPVAGAGEDANESMFSRAARRISFNWAAKPPELPPKTDEA